jgi:hypothetical protein
MHVISTNLNAVSILFFVNRVSRRVWMNRNFYSLPNQKTRQMSFNRFTTISSPQLIIYIIPRIVSLIPFDKSTELWLVLYAIYIFVYAIGLLIVFYRKLLTWRYVHLITGLVMVVGDVLEWTSYLLVRIDDETNTEVASNLFIGHYATIPVVLLLIIISCLHRTPDETPDNAEVELSRLIIEE